ncbi:SLBB domain-containing protein [Uliginosibacterium sp. sgz301328]|uniref:SLBB domain-containing protein n=1 Tax=Uliginosibacterium sp. sgz301328 TaxID=3243764 RepID=UPI00359E0F1F
MQESNKAVPAGDAAPTEFQRFVQTSTGSLLPIFGRDLFSKAANFAPVENVAAPADHIVGPGDEIFIRGWGQIDVEVRSVVSPEGTISIPRVGIVKVAGVRYQNLQDHIAAAVGRYYRNFELDVSLGKLGALQVFVVGQAERPGLYTISSLSTLTNALFAAGGPSSMGSMRHIQLRRGDKTVAELDLYDILLKGDKSSDQRLQSGDVIFIPPVGPVAAVSGAVKAPAIYELKGKNSTIGELVGFAGGITTTASTKRLLLERLDGIKGRQVSDTAFDDSSLSRTLRDGDIVRIDSQSQKYDNAITLRGNVAQPLRTEWRQGLRVSDVVPDRSMLIDEAYWQRAAGRAYSTGPRSTDAVRNDIQHLLDEVNWDYAVVERLNRQTLNTTLLPFNLAKALEKDEQNNVVLQPGDIITIFSKKDVRVPVDKRSAYVRVEGEVQVPGVYQVLPGETLQDVVKRAGGLTSRAYLFGSEFTRESVRIDQQRRLEEVIDRAERDLQASVAQRSARASSAEELASVRAQEENQRNTLQRMRNLRSSGRIVLELDPDANLAALPALRLEDGDRYYVPPAGATVGVYGATYQQTALIYKPNKTVNDYLEQAGGPTRNADSGSTYVLRADGSVISKRQSGWFGSFGGTHLMPDDSVVVPEDYNPFSWIKELKDWSQIFYQFGLGVSAIKVLRD